MKLSRVTIRDVGYINTKRIYYCGYSKDYLKEMFEKFPEFNKVEAIIDDNKRSKECPDVNGKLLKVYSSQYLLQTNLVETVIVITCDYYLETYDKLVELLKDTDYEEDIYYFENRETEIERHYRERYNECDLENILLFRSGPHAAAYVKGMDFSDNARALFEYMLDIGVNERYELIWMVKSPEEFSKNHSVKNVSFVSFDWSVSENEENRELYYRALCLAKYIFFTDAYGFARNCRADQTRVQLWHGCGFKTRVNFVRCEKRYEYTTVISDLYSKIHQEIYGLRSDQMLVTGYAKQDLLFHPIEDFAKRLSLPEAVKYIFWLPTFRTARKELDNLSEYTMENQTGLPILDTFEEIENLNEVLKIRETILLVKLHPFQDKSQIFSAEMSNIIFLDNDVLFDNDIHINELLGWADALISDYSSVAVDYMLLDRPIAFTLDDVDEYKNSRGFVFENIQEWLPGEEIYNYDDFRRYIIEVSEGKDSKREKRKILLDKMHKYHDSNSCRRILEALKIIKDERGDGTNEI